LAAIAVIANHLPPAQCLRMQRRAYSRIVKIHTARAIKLAARAPKLALLHAEAARVAAAFLPRSLRDNWRRATIDRLERKLKLMKAADEGTR
jgi:hypothetical protein